MSTDGEYHQYISAAYLERLTQEFVHYRERTHTEMGDSDGVCSQLISVGTIEIESGY
jgi:hypothetical protein